MATSVKALMEITTLSFRWSPPETSPIPCLSETFNRRCWLLNNAWMRIMQT